jgi:3-hydroxy acid dehydrogenase / malonic semialdehyde reductase
MILITGSSAGIGESCARAFARAGQELILVARRKDRIDRLAKVLSEEFMIKTCGFALDISDRSAVEAFFSNESKLLKKVTVLINNAGLARGLGTIQEGELTDFETMLDTNVKGLLYVTRLLLPHFIENKAGHVVNIGSVAGHYVYPRGNVYCSTKYAVRALTEAMRLDLNGTGIRVTEISPGMVETEFSEVRLGDSQKAKAVYAGMTPLTPDDVAEAVLWATQRPARVNIQEIIIYPTDQASPMVINRNP